MKLFTKPDLHAPRWGLGLANLITIGVGGAAGYVSWQHLSHLGAEHGATPEGAFLTPFTIDGMIVVGTLELRQARKEGRPAKPWAYGAVLFGVAGTIAGNVAAARAGDLTARLYFAAPALAFLVSVEVLFGKPLSRNLWEIIRGWASKARKIKRAPEPETAVKVPEKPAEPLTPHSVPTLPTGPAPGATRKPAGRTAPKRPTALPTGSRTRPERLVGDKILGGDDLRDDARERIRTALADGRKREGLGAWVAREYNPPMSDRWGAERVAEVPDGPGEAAPVIEPLPVTEDAVDLDAELAELGQTG